jgi:hypothetical protein
MIFRRLIAGIALVLSWAGGAAQAQLPTFQPLLSPNGARVLEVRFGSQPANRGLVFVAAITAGPVSGSTSVLLMQSTAAQLFTPGSPAPGWTTVRSAISAYSLGGGCARGNLIDFPFINGSRPEILRITGTTQQVITLGISNSDQYDSIDCSASPSGQVVYMLTNRTRQRLELRREQGGMLALVRDDFGVVRTPFQGGLRPSITWSRVRAAGAGLRGGLEIAAWWMLHDLQNDGDAAMESVVTAIDWSDPLLPTSTRCELGQRPDPTGFTQVNETAIAGNLALGDVNGSSTFQLRLFSGAQPVCGLGPVSQLSTRGGGSLFTYTGVAGGAWPGASDSEGPFPIAVVADYNAAVFSVDGARRDVPLPGAGRGGWRAVCPLEGRSPLGGAIIAVPGTTDSLLQFVAIPTPTGPGDDLLFGSGLELPFDQNPPSCSNDTLQFIRGSFSF